ncbi:tyrosine-protein phosphatase 10D-like [Dreissena polymorpha]|uniref:tyrosine-protein phosphatase 10D-like n=1 Tax=Dreissena polymorpha TaxID=45954 RepID=UPI002264D7BB|nr:tyrosine-protein phosphatase 10D-like [Dreissena polymorpha]
MGPRAYVQIITLEDNELATEAIIGDLDAYWNYSIDVTAVTSFGDDTRHSNTSTINIRTEEGVPGPVTNLTVRNETNLEKPRQLFVSWQPPTERDINGIIAQYVIFCSNRDQKVWAMTGKGNGTSTELVIPVSPGAPVHANETQATPLTKKADFSLDDDKKMVAVLLPKIFLCDNHNGKPEKWGVIVAEASKANETSFVGSLDEYESHKSNYYWYWSKAIDEKNIPPYLATYSAWTPNCGKVETNRRRRDVNNEEYLLFIVGNQDCSSNNGFCNGPLQPGKSYRVKSYACTSSGCTETLYSNPIHTAPNLIPAIAGGLAAAVVVIVIVAVIVYTKRTNKLCFSGNSKTVESAHIGKTIEIPVVVSEYIFKPGAVELTAFPSHLEKMHKDSNLLFADAFKMLKDKSPVHPCSAAESQQCRPKNRYTNIMPFDHSRVKLRALDDVEGSDFINANFVPGYTSPRAFIATQGPMQMTFDEFWRMVWEQNVDTIVMLTKLVEKGRIKCDQYWPNTNDPVFYGEVVVSIKSESNLSDYTLKIFEIKTSKGASRMVKHFWYLKWPDMGCPEDPKMLLDFVKTVRQHTNRPDRTSPTVVHCSAGVGRTGTFIAVDNLLQHIRDHDSVDIFQLVLDMREHRCNMVQTEDQFVFIYECLKAFITTDEGEEHICDSNSLAMPRSERLSYGVQKQHQRS